MQSLIASGFEWSSLLRYEATWGLTKHTPLPSRHHWHRSNIVRDSIKRLKIVRNSYASGLENAGNALVVRNYLSSMAFKNITRLAFGKRFVNSDGVLDKQGAEFKGIVANGLKLGALFSLGAYVTWLKWMFPLKEEVISKHGAGKDRLTRANMDTCMKW